jgi:hypothetical protein
VWTKALGLKAGLTGSDDGTKFFESLAPPKRASRVAIVGEPIVVSMELTNPLALSIEVQELRLQCRHTPPAVDANGNGGAAPDTPAATTPYLVVHPFLLVINPVSFLN